MRAPFTEKDFYKHNPNLDSERLTEKFDLLWAEELKSPNPSVLRIIIKAYGWYVFLWGLAFALMETVTRGIQPLCLGYLVEYFAADQTTTSEAQAYWSAFGIVFCAFLPVITFHPFIFQFFQVGIKVRVGLTGLVYRKCLKISKSSSNDGLSGKAINIISSDMGKFDVAICFVHDLWRGPVEAIIYGYLMYREIGISAIIGLAFILSFIPLQAWAGKKAVYYRRLTAERSDMRIKLMNEIIQGIQVIKMYAWEKSFAKVISDIRLKEIRGLRGTAYILAAIKSTNVVSKISIFLSITSYIYFGDALTARKVFVISSFFNVLNDSMIHFWPLAITSCAEAYVSAKRILEFLLEGDDRQKIKIYDSKEKKRRESFIKNTIMSNGGSKKKADVGTQRRFVNTESVVKGVNLIKASADWDISSIENPNPAIKDCDVDIKDKTLVAIVGPVGGGKSTFLNVLLGEVPLCEGEVHINGRMSYASQEPWVFEGTVRDNIVFIDEYDPVRYAKVIKACALQQDFKLFPHGDNTIVGERGVSLSGGQKARVNLARAVYRKADIYLLDDPLSAVDTHVGRHIFEKCIEGFLKDKIRILVTHQLQYLKDVEHLILMNAGRVEAQGTYKEIQELEEFLSYSQDDDSQESLNRKSSTSSDEKGFSRQSSTISFCDEEEDDGENRKETKESGAVKLENYLYYFRALGNPFFLFSVFFLFIATRGILTGVDYFLSRW